MMSLLSRIFRTIFRSQPKCPLLELFEAEPDATAGIFFEEIGLPYGGVATCRWWKTNRSGFFVKTESVRITKAAWQKDVTKQIRRTKDDFEKVLSLLEEADRPKLKHFSGNLRDGVVYSVAWGTPEGLRNLVIKNPKSESRYSDLIRKLKESTWE